MNISNTKYVIKIDSNKEKDFVNFIISNIYTTNTKNINIKEDLEVCVTHLKTIFQKAWDKHSKEIHIIKHSKE